MKFLGSSKPKRPKRALPERPKPPSEDAIQIIPGRWAGWVKVLVGVAFWVALVLVIDETPVGLRVGDKATHDYVARVEFSCDDYDDTERKRWQADHDEPNVYFNNLSLLSKSRECLGRLLKDAPKAEALPQAAALLEPNLTLTEADFALLKGLDPAGESETEELIERLFTAIGSRGVLDEKDHRKEQELGHDFLSVFSRDRDEPRKLDLTQVVVLDKALPQTLQQRVAAVVQNRHASLVLLMARGLAATLTPTLEFNAEQTEEAKQAARRRVPTQRKTVPQGRTILSLGMRATAQQMLEIQEEKRAYEETTRWSQTHLQRLAGVALLVLLVFCGTGVYVSKYQEEVVRSALHFAVLCCICQVTVACAKLLLNVGWSPYMTPVLLVAIMLTLAYGQRLALAVTAPLVLFVGLAAGSDLRLMVVLGAGGAAAALATDQVRKRTSLIKVGAIAGVAQACAIWALGLASDAELAVVWHDSLWGLGTGIATGFVISGVLPFVEYAFKMTTDISLFGLSDLNQPLLRKLVLEAPGTYHHSLLVGNLSEGAAEAVGANSLLARVGAFYHDIGKTSRPDYFVENTGNRRSAHDDLSPAMSTLIITAHTKDGLELAADFNLPKTVKDVIVQHHGTTMVEYFYQQAVTQGGGNGKVDKDAFRYRGPKPQTREAAIVLLADSVESASRVLSDPTPARIQTLVSEIVEKKLDDAQLDESNLTLTEVHKIEESLVRGLLGIFHSRVRYPTLQENGRETKS